MSSRYLELSELDVAQYLADAPFQEATTMKNIPHCYTLKKKWDDKELFDAIVQYINKHGQVEYFFKTPFTYFYANHCKYWTMSQAGEAILINRVSVQIRRAMRGTKFQQNLWEN